MPDEQNPHEGTGEQHADGMGGEQSLASDLDEGEGKGARLDQAAPTPEAQMADGVSASQASTGTNPQPGHAVQSSQGADAAEGTDATEGTDAGHSRNS
ncbi:MAG: hypothetical protein ABR575_05095 [Actinomycetota bacterium]